MGLISWIIIGIAILAIIGVGIGLFMTGVFEGGKKAQSNPVVANATGEAQKSVGNLISSVTKEQSP